MKHAVLGVGAIGGLIGTTLAALGENVTLIVRPGKLAAFPRQLTLEQPNGIVTASAPSISKLSQSVDVLWIATKTYQLQSALDAVGAAPTAVVPLLNGVDHIAVLRARFGDDLVVPATISVGADHLAEGRFRQGSEVRLNVAASGKALLDDVLKRLHARFGFICTFIQNEQTLLWSKLCFLAPFALVTAASGMDKGGVLGDPEWKAVFYSAITEALTIAGAEGAEVPQSHVQNILDGAPNSMRSSMLKDLIAGRPLELDGIGGPILRAGEKHGISVPTTRKLMDTIDAKLSVRTS